MSVTDLENIHTNSVKIESIRERADSCTDCDLAKTRTKVVFGTGNVNKKLVLVGEGPSAADNHLGLPFIGPAGDMLQEMLIANDITRSDFWLTNIIKCRAAATTSHNSKNRPPKATEIKACAKWLDSELTIIQPKVILCLGATAAKVLIHSRFRITEERGQWFTDTYYAPYAIATYNPAYVLRQEGHKYESMRNIVIEDIAKAIEKLHQSEEIPKTTLF